MSFVVPGNPVPKARPRFGSGRARSPESTRLAEERIRAFARNAGLRRPWPGPLRLEVAFYRRDARPCDLDNLVKLVQDALNGIAYQDDRQVVALTAAKGVDRARPRTEIALLRVAGAAVPARGGGLATVPGDCAPRGVAEGAAEGLERGSTPPGGEP